MSFYLVWSRFARMVLLAILLSGVFSGSVTAQMATPEVPSSGGETSPSVVGDSHDPSDVPATPASASQDPVSPEGANQEQDIVARPASLAADNNDILNLLELTCDVPDSPEIARGQSASINCNLSATATLNLLGLGTLGATIRFGSLPEGVAVQLSSQGLCPGGLVTICVGDLSANLFGNPIPITVFIAPQCSALAGESTVTVTATFALTLLGIRTELGSKSVPITYRVTNDGTAPSALVTDDVDLGTSMWNGVAYEPGFMSASLAVTVAPPTTGCLTPDSMVTVSVETSLTSAAGVIPNENLGVSSVAESQTVPWGSAINAPGSLDVPRHVFKTTSREANPTNNAGITIVFGLTPQSASPGDYSGTIVLTTSQGPD